MAYNQFSFLLLLCFCVLSFSSSIPHPCRKDQSISLLKFKQNFTIDPSDSSCLPKTSSWNVSRDCCSWDGVTCDETTGHVIELDLRCSQLVGKIDSNSSLFQLSHLQRLDLSLNNFSNSHISPEFGRFSSLTHLDLSESYFSGQIPSEISHLSRLQSLRLLSSETDLRLAAHDFKLLLQNLTQLTELDLAGINFSSTIPQNFSSHLTTLRSLSLSNCNLRGPIPESLSNLTLLESLLLAGNTLNGTIPSGMFSQLPLLRYLDLSDNHFSGLLEDFNSNSLQEIDLSNNQLQGHLPNSIQNLYLIGTFPMWLGTLPKLQVLILRLNKLHGSIGTLRNENMFLKLLIIDLSYNAFSGNLPKSLFQCLKAMRIVDQTMKAPTYLGDDYYRDSVTVATKGLELELVKILTVYTTIDLSSNIFEGRIPSIMGELIALRVLNLSHNELKSDIPLSLGNLSEVESLDLSYNYLTGEIPQQLASLTFLAFLNLSHNHLRGCIPQGPQFATFENYSYEGNDGLRGFPVSKGCGNDHVSDTVSGLDDQESDSEFLNDFWKSALMGYGSGLCIGFSIIYMVSTRNPIWLARILLKLDHKIITRRKKMQRLLRNNRRRNNLSIK
ncbi:hypothetical protein CQW23_29333 [Capsicum baccatum]|uniref:Leucine-rich repeat-containing N-terminal plant-type domain-containing protein n=1 Tax=Capsicum baccatum TaxID=33114 RepID=A0A2G2VJ45_CAPBA|nr:hypothetical protein CQW23_29333 [Capsicum baccatum]